MLLKISAKKLFFSYITILVILAIIPINGMTKTDINDVYVIHIRLDHLLHSLVYLPFAFLYLHTFNPALKYNKWLMVFAEFAMASFTEGIQYFLTYRAYNINDLLANYLGVGLGCILAITWYSIIKNKQVL